MRILLVSLIALNLLYAFWERVMPHQTYNSVAPLENNLKPLLLLRENNSHTGLMVDESVSEVDLVDSKEELEEENSELILDKANKEKIISCYTLGPFKDKEILQQLRGSIDEHVKNSTIRKREESEKHRYWVHIPALSSRKKVRATELKLKNKKIKDFYVLFKGDLKNSISLGHFRDPDGANRRMINIIKQGFNAKTEVIYRQYDLYWLDYQLETEGDSLGFSVEAYLTDGVSQLHRDCD